MRAIEATDLGRAYGERVALSGVSFEPGGRRDARGLRLQRRGQDDVPADPGDPAAAASRVACRSWVTRSRGKAGRRAGRSASSGMSRCSTAT